MASTHKHIRSSTANKRPTTAIADGQIALNTNSTSPGLFFKDSTGATIIKIGPVHVGTTAPNVSPAAGGSSGNSTGEVWLDTSLTPVGVKIWNGSTWTNATPIGSTTVQGLLELATSAETQAGTDTDRAVTPAGLQSKVSDSTSTTSSTTIASSTAVKAAYDLANAALPKSGGTVTGNLEIGSAGSLTFEGSTADAFETTLAVADPTADRIITLPDTTGTVITTGDTGTVTSTMIADGTIVDGDISATAEIAVSKLADGAARQLLQTDAAGTGVEWTSNVDVPGTLDVTGAAVFDSSVSVTGTLTKSGNNVVTVGDTGTVTSAMIADGTIVDADISATAEIAVSKLADGAARQLLQTDAAGTGVEWASNIDIPGTLDVTSAATFDSTIGASAGAAATPSITFTGDLNTGLWSPGADTVAASTAGSERLRIDSSGRVGIGTTSPGANLYVNSSSNTELVIDAPSGTPIVSLLAGGAGEPVVGYKNSLRAGTVTGVGGAGFSEKARLDSSGRVGIGTTSPGTTLDVNGGCQITGSASGYSGGEVRLGATTADLQHSISTQSTGTPFMFFDHRGTSNTGIFAWRVGTGGASERMRIDSSGRLLVGTSSARSNFYNTSTVSPSLQVEGTTYSTSSISLVANGNTATSNPYPLLAFGRSRGTALGSNTVTVSGDTIGQISFQGNDGSEFVEAASITCYVDGNPGANDMPGFLAFATTADGASSPTERMRITNQGILNLNGQRSGFGTPMSGSGNVRVAAASAGGIAISTFDIQDYTAIQFVREVSGTAQQVGTITCSSSATAYNTSSDYRLKENVVALDGAVTRLKQIPVHRFNFIVEPDKTVDGFLAHEVQDVVPEAITGKKDEVDADGVPVYQGIDQSKLVPLLTAALQEAIAKIETLEAKVAALENA